MAGAGERLPGAPRMRNHQHSKPGCLREHNPPIGRRRLHRMPERVQLQRHKTQPGHATLRLRGVGGGVLLVWAQVHDAAGPPGRRLRYVCDPVVHRDRIARAREWNHRHPVEAMALGRSQYRLLGTSRSNTRQSPRCWCASISTRREYPSSGSDLRAESLPVMLSEALVGWLWVHLCHRETSDTGV